MSALGKIFTILVFLAACVSLGVNSTLYLKRRDYARAYENVKKTLQQISDHDTKRILALEQQVRDREQQISANQAVVSSLKQSLQTLGSRFEESSRELAQRSAEFGILLESHRTVAEKLGETVAQIDKLQAELDTAKNERNTAYKDKETAEEQLAVMVARVADFEEDNYDLKKILAVAQEDLSAADATLALLRERYQLSELLVGVPPPPIDAAVVFADNSITPAVCSLTVGASDGVKAGYTFIIYRGQEFVGQVIVEIVEEDMCHCRVLFTKNGMQVKATDQARTR